MREWRVLRRQPTIIETKHVDHIRALACFMCATTNVWANSEFFHRVLTPHVTENMEQFKGKKIEAVS